MMPRHCLSCRLMCLLIGVLLAACSADSTPTAQPINTVEPTLRPVTAVPTAAVVASATSTPVPPSVTPTQMPPTLMPTATASPTEAAPATFTPTATVAVARFEDHYVLQRPIPRTAAVPDRIDYLDRTYPYGGTQFGAREVHLGVEFVNQRFTPVVAAADGRVIFAGQDDVQLFGPELDYYGNLVVLAHDALQSPEGLPVFTLYGHLERVEVEAGQAVRAGDKLGVVGDSGIAIGPHLHFEVRVGTHSDYRSTRNPDLWIQPYPRYGTLAGILTLSDGTPASGQPILVRDDERTRETYVYGGERVNPSASWGENFTLGDLPVGMYTIIVSDNGRVRWQQSVSIEAGRTTFIEIEIAP